MAAGDRYQGAAYPGVISVLSCTYTNSHGISPGTAILRCLPQANLPSLFGNLTITDGVGLIVVPGCRFDQARSTIGSDGQVWNLEIVDRRWKWRQLGDISGEYNMLDPHGKLTPWTIRSPYELAVLCLQVLGEVPGILDMPAGLDSSFDTKLNQFLPNGINYPPTGTNPPVNWQADPPAMVLQRLCDYYNRRIIYDVTTDKVNIVQLGIGADLPIQGLSIARISPSLKSRETPDGVKCVGSQIRFQSRFLVEAVGEEWNGELLPINQLSYAPLMPKGSAMVCKLEIIRNDAGDLPTTNGQITLTVNGVEFHQIYNDGPSADTILNAMATAVNADPVIKNVCTASVRNIDNDGIVSYAELVLLPVAAAQFNVQTTLDGLLLGDGLVNWTNAETAGAGPSLPGWEYSAPPSFPNVRATDRLTQWQARALAQKSVFKYFRIVNRDVRLVPATQTPNSKQPLTVPGFGQIERIQQIHLFDTKVDQILPSPFENGVRDARGQPIVLNYYNGYSKDQKATVTGSVYFECIQKAGTLLNSSDVMGNTPFYSTVYIPFNVDPDWQMIIFQEHVWEGGQGGVPGIWNVDLEADNADTEGYFVLQVRFGGQVYTFTYLANPAVTPDTVLDDFAEQINDDNVLSSLGFEAEVVNDTLQITGPAPESNWSVNAFQGPYYLCFSPSNAVRTHLASLGVPGTGAGPVGAGWNIVMALTGGGASPHLYQSNTFNFAGGGAVFRWALDTEARVLQFVNTTGNNVVQQWHLNGDVWTYPLLATGEGPTDIPLGEPGGPANLNIEIGPWSGDPAGIIGGGAPPSAGGMVNVAPPMTAGTTFEAVLQQQGAESPQRGLGIFLEPTLTLETSCHVRAADTNAFVRYVQARDFGQGAGTLYAVTKHEDVRLEITAKYNEFNELQGFTPLDIDPIARAKFYLDGMSLQYLMSNAQTIEYNGVVPISLDGAIQQVTWTIGEGGASTIASRNTEHDIFYPPYPARRRAELIPSLESQGLGNQNTNPAWYTAP